MADENNLNPGSVTPPGAPAPAPAPGGALAALPDLAGKRGRGRPRKPAGLTPPPVPGAESGKPIPGNQPAGDIVAPLWTRENSRPIGQLPFLGVGIAFDWDGWALNDKEADAIAEPLAQVLNAFVPQGGKYAAVTALGSTLFVLGAMKYKGYREHVAEEAKKEATK